MDLAHEDCLFAFVVIFGKKSAIDEVLSKESIRDKEFSRFPSSCHWIETKTFVAPLQSRGFGKISET